MNAKDDFGAANAGAFGCEGASGVIKRRHGLRRCRYQGIDGMHRWVGLGVFADNLINMADASGASRRSGERESVSGSPRGEAPRIRLV